MGMDVYGEAATAEVGQYFRRNVWGWRPLAEMVTTLLPRETAPCRHWQSNDGDGLDAEGAAALAGALEVLIANGYVESYIRSRDAELATLPDEPCHLCKATGIRRDAIGTRDGQPSKVIGTDVPAEPDHPRHGDTGWCNGCDGRGASPAFDRHYHLETQDVLDFLAFLQHCGGFTIC